MWFTPAVEPDKLGLDGTLDVTGGEDWRRVDPAAPTLKLFKIRMDLEMEAGTDALQTPARRSSPWSST